MGWTAPITWTVSQLVTAANLNTHVRDNELFLRSFHGARMWQSAAENQTTSGANQLVTWDTTDYDTDAFAVLASEWFAVPTGFDGTYRITAGLAFAGNATGAVRNLILNKNETYAARVPNGVGTVLAQFNATNNTAVAVGAITEWAGPLVAGDHVTIEAFQNSGGSLGLVNGKSTMWFEAHYLGS